MRLYLVAPIAAFLLVSSGCSSDGSDDDPEAVSESPSGIFASRWVLRRRQILKVAFIRSTDILVKYEHRCRSDQTVADDLAASG